MCVMLPYLKKRVTVHKLLKMGFRISEYIMPTLGGDDGGGGGNTLPEKLPLPYWHSVDDERLVPLRAGYQVPKLLYIVTRNGVHQQPKVDFQLRDATTLEFIEPLTPGEFVSFFPTGFSA
jgi:hypothetical protein